MSIDPTRINNYNKFLSTLDNNPNLKINYLEKDAVELLRTKFNTVDASNNILKNVEKEKNALDKFIKEVNQKIPKNTDNTINDKCCIDPNYYRDIKNEKLNLNSLSHLNKNNNLIILY